MYRIHDEEFELDSSGIVGRLDDEDGLFWAIDVYAKGKETKRFDYIEPKLSFTRLPHPNGTDPLLNRVHFPKAEAYDYDIDDWIGDFYIFDAHFFRSEILLIRTSKSQFHIHWKGEVDISYETTPDEEFIPFEIDLEIPFHGILCDFINEDESRALLKDICDVSKFFWIEDGNKFFDRAFFSTRDLRKR